MGQNRWASRAPTDPQGDRLKDGEGAVYHRQKRTDTDKQQDRVLEEKKKEEEEEEEVKNYWWIFLGLVK
jgi:hypothetical protein